MGYNIGPKIGIEGEQQFRKQIRDINTEYKTLEAETRAVTAAFEANGDEQGKLGATAKQLQKQIDNQKQKMETLQEVLKRTADLHGENSVEATRLRGVIYDTQATITGLEGKLKDAKDRLDQTGNALEDLGEEADDAGKQVVDFGDLLKANLASDLIMAGLEKIGDLVKDFASGTIEAAAEVKAANSQFSQSFGDLEEDAKAALASISDDTNIASTRMQESYTRIFAFAKTAGTESDEALDIAARAMVAAADSAAYYDRSIEEVTETLQSFLKGNYANDAALGISATEVSRNTKANELYAVSFQELSESQKVDVLLAMVEAGNAASGAIGQAARESDSWENVTGELSEAMKQLQAEAGKSALKKLTPIIQDITDGVYELIDDIDWEEFGDTVADVVDTVVDNGPDILKTITSIAAGFVAFKATKKAQQLVTIANSFLQIGTAAKTAGAATAASGALAAASPWGLAAVAIGGVVALVTSLAIETETSVSDLERSTEQLEKSFSSAKETYDETIAETEGAAYAAEYYVDRLDELAAAGLDSAAANREYEMTVEALNELIPELNLTIDEQTGLVTENTDAIRANIDAWKEDATAKALQEKFSDELEAQGKAEAELIESQAKLNILRDEHVDLYKKAEKIDEEFATVSEKLAEAQQKYATATDLSAEESDKLAQQIFELTSRQESLGNEYMDLQYSLDENERAQRDLNSEISEAKDVVASYEDEIQLASEAMKLFGEQTDDTGDGQDEFNAKVQAVQDQIDNLVVAYGKAKDSARESIDSQIGLFDTLKEESEFSASSILENWEKQQQAISDYNENLKKASKLGLDEELLSQLSDGSEQSMQALDALVNDSNVRINEINEEFKKLDTAKNTLSDTMAEMETAFDESLERIVKQANESGVATIDGLILGMDVSKWETHVKKLADSWEVYDEAMDINSPSRVAMKSTEFTVEGAIIGVDNMISDFEAKMAELASSGNMAYLRNQLDRAESYPDMYTPHISSPVNNNSRTVNFGGLNVQIYAQPGQNEYEIAEAVQEVIQTEIARLEAAL